MQEISANRGLIKGLWAAIKTPIKNTNDAVYIILTEGAITWSENSKMLLEIECQTDCS